VQPLTRRSLLTGSAFAVAAAVAGFVVARNSSAAQAAANGTYAANGYGPGGPSGNSGTAAIASVAQVTGDGIVAGGVVLTRDSSGGVHGVSATCTHQGCTVGSPQGRTVTCPCHGSQFDAVTGKVLRGPATRPLPPVPVHVQGDQVVRG